MRKTIVLVASVALLFTGCHSRSPVWKKVVATPRATGDAENRDRAYAAELHQQLGATPHKVVSYEHERFAGQQTAQRTAVLYFDSKNPKQPWWIMHPELAKPVWVPNEPLPDQVAFFARGSARVVEVQDYTESRDKTIQPLDREQRPVAISTLQRVEPAGSAPPIARRASATTRIAEPREPKPWWRLFGKPTAKKEPATTRLEPIAPTRIVKTSAKRSPATTARKASATETITPAENRSASPKRDRRIKGEAPNEQPSSLQDPPVLEQPPAISAERKPAVAPEPKKRPSLFNRDKSEPAPAANSPSGGAAAERPRRNFFQRILGSLNPARFFRKAA